MRQLQQHRQRIHRPGFTLIELLVVISVITILFSLTVGALSYNSDADRVRQGARQLQSYLKGAQNRAIYSGRPVGVRLFVDNDAAVSPAGRTVSSAAYVSDRINWSAPRDSASVTLERIDSDGNGTIDLGTIDDNVVLVRGRNNPGWFNLFDRGYFNGNVRIRLPAGPKGDWYPFTFVETEDTNGNGMLDPGEDLNLDANIDTNFLRLGLPYADPDNPSPALIGSDLVNYEMELAWQLLPEEPCVLPDAVVIDMDASRVPSTWRPPGMTERYSPYMDIVFSPQGTLIGDAAAAGVLHLCVCDQQDSEFLKTQFMAQLATVGKDLSDLNSGVATAPFVPLDEVPVLATDWVGTGDSYVVRERRLVSVFGQTGNIAISQVNAYAGEAAGTAADERDPYDFDGDGFYGPPVDVSPYEDGLADDPYRFAETGEGGN